MPSERLRLSITGMTCAGCVNAVTRVLSRIPHAANIRVDLGAGWAELDGATDPDVVLAAVRNAGYGAELLPS